MEEDEEELLLRLGLLPLADQVAQDLAGFDVHPDRGFAPKPDPVPRLPAHSGFAAHEALADALPTLLASGQLRPAVNALNAETTAAAAAAGEVDWNARVDALAGEGERRRALLLLGGLANAYVWGGGPDVAPRDRIPACLAVPLVRVAAALETAPILSHMSNCLYNWKRKKSADGGNDDDDDDDDDEKVGQLRAEALDTCFSFTGRREEAMFYLLTLEIEGIGGPALAVLERARRLVARLATAPTPPPPVVASAHRWLAAALGRRVKGCLDRMRAVMELLPLHVPPAVFYRRIRPYLAGWKDNPTLPEGVVYEGVGGDGEEGGGGARLQFSGGSAAQSSIIAALDLYLGIALGGSSAASHASYAFIKSMRAYMPGPHRRFLDALVADSMEEARSIRGYVAGLVSSSIGGQDGAGGVEVVAAYDACVEALVAFRRAHLSIVHAYIVRQQREKEEEDGVGGAGEPGGLERAAGGKGTGGMPLLEFLAPLKEETAAARLAQGGGGEKEG